MTAEAMWVLFLATGLPEAYSLCAHLKTEEESPEKTA
jgi:hypothetical protein